MGQDGRNLTSGVISDRDLRFLTGAVAADLVAVIGYVLIGRHAHGESIGPAGFARTAWPFLVGVIGGYVGVAMTRWPVISPRGGSVVVGKCLILGLVLRYGVQRSGTPLPYIVVTVLVLTAFMMGWRLATQAWLRRDLPQRAPTSPA